MEERSYGEDDHAANRGANDHKGSSAEQEHQTHFPPELHSRYEKHGQWDSEEIDVGRDVEGVIDPDDLIGDCWLAYVWQQH